jgi:hypothetical protein
MATCDFRFGSSLPGRDVSHEAFDPVAVGFQERAESFGGWESNEIAGDEELLIYASGGELDFCTVAITAQEDPQGRVVAFGGHVGFEPVQIEIHLAGVAGLEGTHLEINEHVAAEDAVIEHQVHAVMPAALGHAELTGLETEAATELEDELLQVIEKCGFEFVLRVFWAVHEAGEFQDVGITQGIGNGLPGLLSMGTLDDSLLVLRKHRALE